MARIPLLVASRSLDTGSVVQYPGGGEVGRAMEGAGNELQQVASHFKAVQDQQEAFAAKIKENEFAVDMSTAEDEATRNAPADGSGIHDSLYGQVDPRTGQTVKTGSFDTNFDATLAKMPESQKAEFAAKRELYRKQGSERMAAVQYDAQQKYYDVEIAKQQNQTLVSIAAADPNDKKTVDALKKQGLEFIEASPKSALYKDAAKAEWLAKSEEAAYQGRLAKDPSFAEHGRTELGMAPVTPGNAVSLLRKFEGFRSTPYWDVNANRIGYGSDTITRADGSIKKVTPGDRVSRADADRDLARRAAEFETSAIHDVGRAAWERLPPNARAALVSTTYNYGSLPRSVAAAVRGGDINQVASAVEALGGQNDGVNRKRRREEAAIIRGGAIPASGNDAPNPEYANIPLDRRLSLANQADVQYRQQQASDLANQKASYTAYKDRIELTLVQGQIADPAIISGDKTLNDGDKASLLRSFNEQNKGIIQVQSDLAALNGNSLTLDPYASDDKKRADNLYSAAVGHVPQEQQAALGTAIINQTGVVPQPIINNMRQGLSSRNPAQVIAAAQAAQQISAYDPAALARRDGGSEVQKAANDFSFYVNKLNLPVEEAARRMIDNASPEKQRDRKVLEPAAKEFVKTLTDVDLASEFKEGWFGSPSLGSNPEQELGIKADFMAIAEDQFYAANGDPELAKNRALEQMKVLYGVSSMSGSQTVVKHPPERYWPKQDSTGGPLGIGADPFQYAKTQLNIAIGEQDPNFQPGTIRLVTTPETDADVKAGRLPGYAVMWKDENGNLQTIPGKVWRPDVKNMIESQQEKRAKEQSDATDAAREKDLQDISGQDRRFSLDNMLGGNTKVYTPEMRQKFLNEQAAPPKADPGSNIPTDIAKPKGGR